MEFLRSRRARVKLSQAALAARCGCHVTHICQIEKGRHHPSLEVFAALARELKVSPTRLLRELLLLKKPEARGSVTELSKERERRERRN